MFVVSVNKAIWDLGWLWDYKKCRCHGIFQPIYSSARLSVTYIVKILFCLQNCFWPQSHSRCGKADWRLRYRWRFVPTSWKWIITKTKRTGSSFKEASEVRQNCFAGFRWSVLWALMHIAAHAEMIYKHCECWSTVSGRKVITLEGGKTGGVSKNPHTSSPTYHLR